MNDFKKIELVLFRFPGVSQNFKVSYFRDALYFQVAPGILKEREGLN